MFSEMALHSELTAFFTNCYGTNASYLVMSPGRVNLIGEHTDYNLLPVMPMTLDRGIEMAVSPQEEPMIELFNSDSQFSPTSFSLSDNIPPAAPGDWSNYVRAACQALVPHIVKQGKPVKGFKAAVQSNLPPASGLSSSSALVIASCLAFCTANQLVMDKKEIAELMRVAEHYVGTAGGGMDQAIISLGQAEHALLIEFDPLTTTPVRVPQELSIFVINSGEQADKSGTAKLAYNRRALECRIGVELLKVWAHQQAAPALAQQAESWTTLRDVFRDLTTANIPLAAAVLEATGTEPQSLSSISAALTPEIVSELTAAKKMPPPNDPHWENTQLAVYNRVSHVFAETLRVYRFAQALEHSRVPEAAQLAVASHASCRDLYHISTPAIERLVTQSCKAGALGARITGAGFGGCIVAFVPIEKKSHFVETMAAHLVGRGTENLRNSIIECKSAGGASVRIAL